MSNETRIEEAKVRKAENEADEAFMKYVQVAAKVRPCHSYPVKVYHNDVTWVCEAQFSSDAVGHGDTPSAAMIAFDNMWLGLKDVSVDG